MALHGYTHPTRDGEQLARILLELGYEGRGGSGINLDAVVNRLNRAQLMRRVSRRQLYCVIYEGRKLTLELAKNLAVAVGFDLNELAYGEPGTRDARKARARARAASGGSVRGVVGEIEPSVDRPRKYRRRGP